MAGARKGKRRAAAAPAAPASGSGSDSDAGPQQASPPASKKRGKRVAEESPQPPAAPAPVPDVAPVDDSDSDEAGPPRPMGLEQGPTESSTQQGAPSSKERKRKKPRDLQLEKVLLEALPSAEHYERSYMHRDVVTHVVVTPCQTDFVISASEDGHVKFWKKMPEGIEFVKHYHAHLKPIHEVCVSADGQRLATTSADRTIKFYDVVSFDMSHMIDLNRAKKTKAEEPKEKEKDQAVAGKTKEADARPAEKNFVPGRAAWINVRGHAGRLAVADAEGVNGAIRVYADDGSQRPVAELLRLHIRGPVCCLALNAAAGVVVSADARGGLEYWAAAGTAGGGGEVAGGPPPKGAVSFRMKMETDLYALQKAKTRACSISFSPDGAAMAITARDKKLRVFDFRTGKLRRVYDESLPIYEAAQTAQAEAEAAAQQAAALAAAADDDDEEAGPPPPPLPVPVNLLALDPNDFGKRAAGERELEGSAALSAAPQGVGGALDRQNAVFDESGAFLLFATMVGVKVVHLESNRLVRVLGKEEGQQRFLQVALFQGVARVDTQMLLARDNKSRTAEEMAKAKEPDPTLVCTAFDKKRFYLFSRRLPGEDGDVEGRDVFNERPTAEEMMVTEPAAAALGRHATLRTTMGDIHLKLFPDECPRTVENFCTHACNGYYDNVIFHRVMKGFMVQTGDPKGDGTGGESIWGGDFEDEFHRDLRHDRPFTLSMANSGADTNGSQFFITVIPTPWLDSKHTVFGRVTKGMETVHRIENVPTDSTDKPFDDIKILNIEISTD